MVILDNKLEDLEDKESSNLKNFITSSSSSSNDNREDNASNDKEYSSKKYNKVDNKEGSCKDLEDNKVAKLSA